MRNKVILFFATALTAILVMPFFVYAHPGNTDSSGCHTCRTNCSSWGLSSGEYHCHQSKGVPQPSEPVRSHNSGYTEPWPDYSYPSSGSSSSYPSTPSCPSMSSYDSLSGSCKCYAGYVVDGGSCVSGDSYCHKKYGYNSDYDSISKTCECDYGYMLNSSGQCVSQNSYCQNIFGYNSEYNILTKKCECKDGYIADSGGNSCISGDSYCHSKYGYNGSFNDYRENCECDSGYVLNSSKTKCISEDEWCEEQFGYNSSYNNLYDSCKCKDGYNLEGGRCVIKIKAPVIPSVPKIIPQSVPEPTPKPLPQPKQEVKSAPATPEQGIKEAVSEERPPIIATNIATKNESNNPKAQNLIANVSGVIKGFFKKIFGLF